MRSLFNTSLSPLIHSNRAERDFQFNASVVPVYQIRVGFLHADCDFGQALQGTLERCSTSVLVISELAFAILLHTLKLSIEKLQAMLKVAQTDTVTGLG